MWIVRPVCELVHLAASGQPWQAVAKRAICPSVTALNATV